MSCQTPGHLGRRSLLERDTLTLPENVGLHVAGQEAAYLVAGLGLPNEDESIRGDDGQAEVDENDGSLRADVPVGENRALRSASNRTSSSQGQRLRGLP